MRILFVLAIAVPVLTAYANDKAIPNFGGFQFATACFGMPEKARWIQFEESKTNYFNDNVCVLPWADGPLNGYGIHANGWVDLACQKPTNPDHEVIRYVPKYLYIRTLGQTKPIEFKFEIRHMFGTKENEDRHWGKWRIVFTSVAAPGQVLRFETDKLGLNMVNWTAVRFLVGKNIKDTIYFISAEICC